MTPVAPLQAKCRKKNECRTKNEGKIDCLRAWWTNPMTYYCMGFHISRFIFLLLYVLWYTYDIGRTEPIPKKIIEWGGWNTWMDSCNSILISNFPCHIFVLAFSLSCFLYFLWIFSTLWHFRFSYFSFPCWISCHSWLTFVQGLLYWRKHVCPEGRHSEKFWGGGNWKNREK